MSKQPITASFNTLAPKTFSDYMAIGHNKFQIIAALNRAFDTSDAKQLETSKTLFLSHYGEMSNPARDLFRQAFDEFVVTRLPAMEHKLAAVTALTPIKVAIEYGTGALKAVNAKDLFDIMGGKLNAVVTSRPAFAHMGYHNTISYAPKWS
jgi:hypothetical protein